MPWESFVINCFGRFVDEQMTLLGWGRDALAERSGLDELTIEAILDSPVLPEWPDPDALLALARAFALPVREVVLRAAEGCGLHVTGPLNPAETILLATNEELMREVRRRLALGARTGQYLSSPAQHWEADTSAPSA
jgi:hypothetical protein